MSRFYYSAFFLLSIIIFYGCSSGSRYLFAPKTDIEKQLMEQYIKANPEDEENFVAVQRLAEEYLLSKDWKNAELIFEKYNDFLRNKDCLKKIKALLGSESKNIEVINLGENINTSGSEYNPIPGFDDKILYFCGDIREDGLGGEDVYLSEKKDGKWQKAVNLKAINSKSNEAPLSISGDGNRMILFGNYDDSFGEGDLYYSDRTEAGWGKMQHFPKSINSDYFEGDGFLTADGKVLFFVSDRRGNIGQYHKKGNYFHGSVQGNTDIYISIRKGNEWGNPINLGKMINTSFAERTPFLHPDGKTLYFSSDGYCSIGRLDVYKSIRLNDSSWTEWSEPENLGKEINTPEDDWGYKISTSGDLAYFAKIKPKGSLDDFDIYTCSLPDEFHPNKVARIHGKITDVSGKPLEADIKIEDLTKGGNVGYLKSNPLNGEYYLVLPLGKNYGYFTDKNGYFPISQNIDLEKEDEAKDISEDFVLISIEDMKNKDISIRINNIFFETNKANLKVESYPELNRLSSILQGIPGIKIEIAGYTDNVGNNSYNKELSMKRAQAVMNYLISKGCEFITLTAKGYGENKPIAPNTTEKGRALNRRVEFRVLK